MRILKRTTVWQSKYFLKENNSVYCWLEQDLEILKNTDFKTTFLFFKFCFCCRGFISLQNCRRWTLNPINVQTPSYHFTWLQTIFTVTQHMRQGAQPILGVYTYTIWVRRKLIGCMFMLQFYTYYTFPISCKEHVYNRPAPSVPALLITPSVGPAEGESGVECRSLKECLEKQDLGADHW